MAYTPPTRADFLERFPIFDDAELYPVTTIDLVLAEAISSIDETWREVDYAPAILYLTAHLLSTDNSEAGSDVEFGGIAQVASESFGGMSISYSSNSSSGSLASNELYGSTEYGRRFLALLRRNITGPVVI